MKVSRSRALLRSASRLAIAATAAGILTGCSGIDSMVSSNGQPSASSLRGAEPDGQDFVGGAAFWGAKYEANRNDIAAGMGFARNLRMMGGARQAVAVMKEVVMKAPDNPRVLSEYGKALTAAGRVQDALPFLARSTQINGDDWTTFSAYGVALDQTGNHTAARVNYQTALDLSPGNPTVESNLAMSHVLEGDIGKAEVILRRLVARPDATAQIRQNLAMVTAIKGNSEEAEQLAREDLVPADASNNLALLQQLDPRNAAINIDELAPPASTKEAPTAPLATPAAPAALLSPGPATTADPDAPTDEKVAPAEPISVSKIPQIPASAKPSPYTMAPIADPKEPTRPKSLAPKKASQPNVAPASVSLTPPAATPQTKITPAATAPGNPVSNSKPTAALRRSLHLAECPRRDRQRRQLKSA
jgi:Flp pilus assembly protein TadD